MNRIDTLRITFDMWYRVRIDRLRWRLLRLIPRRIVYWVVIRAWGEACGPTEHPDSLKASDLAQRWQA